jgi:hypothetical protein
LVQGSRILFGFVVIAIAEVYALVWVVDGIRSSLGPVALSSAFGHGVEVGFGGSSVCVLL